VNDDGDSSNNTNGDGDTSNPTNNSDDTINSSNINWEDNDLNKIIHIKPSSE